MTENKRFTVPLKYSLSHSKIQCDGKPLTNDELVRILNTNDGAFLENFNLKKENRTLKLLVQNWEQLDDEKDEQLEKMNDSLKRLVEEKKKLEEEIETLHEQIAHFMEVGDVE